MLRVMLMLFISVNCFARTKIAVIDTGFDSKWMSHVNMCKTGHKDFTSSNNPFTDQHKAQHGTNVAGLVAKYAGDDYCLMIVKWWEESDITSVNQAKSNKAIRWAIDHGADIINYSGGGTQDSMNERNLVREALNKGIIFVAAAGNDKMNLDITSFYPAMHDSRVIVVGCLKNKHERCDFSNHGSSVDVEILGMNKKALGISLSGTSQSTAIMSGLVARNHKKTKRSTASKDVPKN